MRAAEKMTREREQEKRRQAERQKKAKRQRELRERQMKKKRLRQRRYRRALCLQAATALAALTLAFFIGLWGCAQLSRLFLGETDKPEPDFLVTESLKEQVNRVSLPAAGSDGEGGSAQNSSSRSWADSSGNRPGPGEDSTLNLSDPLLLLVNKDNPIPKDYEVSLQALPSGLVSVAEALYDDLMEMLEEGKKQGLHFVVCSGYRSAERQQELLDEDIRACMASGMSYEEAYEEVTRTTMPPDCSEHATGLALDIVALDYQLLDDGQERTAENKWLKENAWRYGFILRYPAGREDVTGIDYESWHFRYVGKEAAEYMYGQGLLLEEVWQP